MKKTTKKETQERVLKDRVFILKNNLSPLTYTIKSRGVYYFDKEKGFERELKYTQNQRTPFADEFKGDARLEHITFEDGVLRVPKEKQTLQKFMELSPDNGKVYEEFDTVQIAVDELQDLELEVEALTAAKTLSLKTLS